MYVRFCHYLIEYNTEVYYYAVCSVHAFRTSQAVQMISVSNHGPKLSIDVMNYSYLSENKWIIFVLLRSV
jgi:hypothetical protein